MSGAALSSFKCLSHLWTAVKPHLFKVKCAVIHEILPSLFSCSHGSPLKLLCFVHVLLGLWTTLLSTVFQEWLCHYQVTCMLQTPLVQYYSVHASFGSSFARSSIKISLNSCLGSYPPGSLPSSFQRCWLSDGVSYFVSMGQFICPIAVFPY